LASSVFLLFRVSWPIRVTAHLLVFVSPHGTGRNNGAVSGGDRDGGVEEPAPPTSVVSQFILRRYGEHMKQWPMVFFDGRDVKCKYLLLK